MDAKIFSSIKKYKKSNAIRFESVPLNIKIDVFSVKKEHTFSGFPNIPTFLFTKLQIGRSQMRLIAQRPLSA